MSFNAIQLSFRGLQRLLNASKAKCMLFNRSLPTPACPSSISTLHSSDLEYVDKYLGVWLDCKLFYKIASNALLRKLDAVYHSFVTKAPYTTQHCDLYALVGWLFLHIRHQTHWLQVIYKSLLGKAPPYLSSLVTIAAPKHSTRICGVDFLMLGQAACPLEAFTTLVTGKGKNIFMHHQMLIDITLQQVGHIKLLPQVGQEHGLWPEWNFG